MTHPDTLIPRAVVEQSIPRWREQCSETTTLGAQLVLMQAEIDALRAALQPQAEDPMDWPLPCDVTVGHGTMSKGVKLRTLVARMKALYEMATGQNANEVEQRSLEKRQLMLIAALQPQASTTTNGPPERDPSKPAEQQGVFRKFNVQRTDGSDKPGGKHHGCEYFVLDVANDKHAKPALEAYSVACATTHPQLSADMRERYGLQPQAADQDPNSPWLSSAHMLCSDQGIPPGHITTRIQALRNKLAAAAPEAT